MFCISTSKRALCMPFAGQNHFFSAKTSFSVFFFHKWEKKNEIAKITKNMHEKGSTSVKVLLLNAG